MIRPLALFLSPHLDDAVFSCGGTVARLADAGWRVEIVTAFTASRPPVGFALACQTDKGIPADVDYMALRRAEDARACRTLGATARWLDLPEAPHRGYANAAALFAGVHPEDEAVSTLAPALAGLAARMPDLVLTAEGIGRHADHIVLRQAAEAEPGFAGRLGFWRDEPYASRQRAPLAPAATAIDISVMLDRKIDASRCYESQLGFQFGGADAVAASLRAAAARSGTGAVEWFSGATDRIARAGLAPAARASGLQTSAHRP